MRFFDISPADLRISLMRVYLGVPSESRLPIAILLPFFRRYLYLVVGDKKNRRRHPSEGEIPGLSISVAIVSKMHKNRGRWSLPKDRKWKMSHTGSKSGVSMPSSHIRDIFPRTFSRFYKLCFGYGRNTTLFLAKEMEKPI